MKHTQKTLRVEDESRLARALRADPLRADGVRSESPVRLRVVERMPVPARDDLDDLWNNVPV